MILIRYTIPCRLLSAIVLIFSSKLLNSVRSAETNVSSVAVFFYALPHWMDNTVWSGMKECGPLQCEFYVSHNMSILSEQHENVKKKDNSTTTVALYNIHR